LVFVDSKIVGLLLVLHTTPLAVILRPPLDIIVPPVTTLFDVIEDTSVVDSVGSVFAFCPFLQPKTRTTAKMIKIFFIKEEFIVFILNIIIFSLREENIP
jgi:hypothetical protein